MTYFIFGLICFRFLVIVCLCVPSVSIHFKMFTALRAVSSDCESNRFSNTVSISPEFLRVPNFKFRMHLFAVSLFVITNYKNFLCFTFADGSRKKNKMFQTERWKGKTCHSFEINIFIQNRYKFCDFIWFHLNSFLHVHSFGSLSFEYQVGSRISCTHSAFSKEQNKTKQKTNEIFLYVYFCHAYTRINRHQKRSKHRSRHRCRKIWTKFLFKRKNRGKIEWKRCGCKTNGFLFRRFNYFCLCLPNGIVNSKYVYYYNFCCAVSNTGVTDLFGIVSWLRYKFHIQYFAYWISQTTWEKRWWNANSRANTFEMNVLYVRQLMRLLI